MKRKIKSRFRFDQKSPLTGSDAQHRQKIIRLGQLRNFLSQDNMKTASGFMEK